MMRRAEDFAESGALVGRSAAACASSGPTTARSFDGISPWVDADALYVRTGALNRPGFAAAAGLSIPIGETRMFWAGPFVRYLHIIQPHRDDYDNHDAKILSLGISLEVGPGLEREARAARRGPHRHQEIFSCPDRDKDGVPDNVDRCPEVAGPMD